MSRTRHRSFLTLIGLTLGIALVLTSCFGGDDETDDTTTTTQASSLPAAPTTVAPPPDTVAVTVAPPPDTAAVTVAPPPDTVAVTVAPPPDTAPTPVVVTPLIYTVQPGDTLFSIARQFDVSVDELIELNNIDNPDVIYVDATLTIPPPG